MKSFEEIPNELQIFGEIYAEKAAEYEFLDDMKKVLIADLASSSDGKSEAEKNRLALGNPKYKKHLEGVREARHKMLQAKGTIEALSARFDWYRSKNANRRAEMNL